MKLAKLQFDVELFERIVTAKDNDYVTTDCPQDLKIVKVLQNDDEQAKHIVTLIVQSEEADWPDVPKFPHSEIPFVGPFTYTVEHPDEDESPPTTGVKNDG